MQPKYDLDKIKFASDGPTFEKAVGIYGYQSAHETNLRIPTNL